MLAALTGDGPAGSTRLARLLDAALTAVTEVGPAVLVVDDMQWADTSTLDLLAYTLTSVREDRTDVTFGSVQHFDQGWPVSTIL